MEDKQLIRFISDNGTAVKKLLQYKFPILSAADIDDAVAEAIAKVWANRERYSEERPFFPLLYLIAKRAALDRLRKIKREQLLRQKFADQLNRESDSDENDPEPTQIAIDLQQAIEKLPELDRKVLHAAIMYPRSENWAKELSMQLDLSPGALRVRRLRAMEKLKAILKEKNYKIPGDLS